jgi:peptide/nickel transport system permease protein
MSRSEETSVSPLRATSTTSESRWSRYQQLLYEHLYVPFLVIWEDWRGRLGLSITISYILMGTVGVRFLETPTYQQGARGTNVFQNLAYPLGTDSQGISLFSQIVHSTPQMLLMVTGGAVFATSIATIVGLTAGYKGGVVDRILMTATDIALTIPGLPLVVVIAAVVQPDNPIVLGMILSINAWAGLARTLRSQALVLRHESYVEASRLMDISLAGIVAKDIMSNVMPYISVNFMNTARSVIFSAVGLYYLGILPYKNENWGTLLDKAFDGGSIWDPAVAYRFYVPLAVIVMFSLGLILLAQAMDAVFNPRIRAKHEADEESINFE